MSDIFLSYSRADRPRAETLARALQAQGWSVWWDRTIPAGRTFDEVIEEAIDAARCVLVLWSKSSVASRWVRSEAEEGAARKILVPVLLDEVRIPLAFRPIQAADLVDWDGGETARAFKTLVADIAAFLGPPPKLEEERRRKAEDEAQRRAEEERQRVEEERERAEVEARREADEAERGREAEAPADAEGPEVGPPRAEVPPQATGLPSAVVPPRPGPEREKERSFRLLRKWALGIGGTVALLTLVLLLGPWSRGPQEPTASLEAEPTEVERGTSTMLSWKTTDATEVRLEPGPGSVEARGSMSVSPEQDTTYRLVAEGAGGSAEDTVMVRVTDDRGPPSSEPEGPIMVGGDVLHPKKIHAPPADYTEIAWKARIQGIVIVQAVIDKQGNVTSVKVLKGLPMGLEEAAVEAVKNWKFEPATLNGKPVSVYYNLTVQFDLQRNP